MKNILALCALLGVFSAVQAEETILPEEVTESVELTEEQTKEIEHLLNELKDKYVELGFHDKIQEAFQEIADQYPDIVKLLIELRGVETEEGGKVLVLPAYYVIQ